MLLYGRSRFPFPLATCIYYLLLISGLFTLALAGRAVSILFFGVAQAFKRRDSAPAYATFRCFCFQFCSVFGGQICFKEAIMLVNYATLWLLTPPLYPCNLYLLFASHFRLIYSGLISWRHRIFFLPRSQYCVQRMSLCRGW